MLGKIFKKLVWLIIVSFMLVRGAVAIDTPAVPKLVIPKCLKAPVIDGKFSEAEWSDACAITGFMGAGSKCLTDLQPVAFLTYDDKNFYFAMKNLFNYKRLANMTKRDSQVINDDAFELFLNPNFGTKAGSMKGYYQFIGNSIGTIYDIKHQPGIGQIYPGWNGNWEFKNSVTENEWIAELSVPFSELGVEAPSDGTKWNITVCRDYSSNAPFQERWTTWSYSSNFSQINRMAEVSFNSLTPAVQILSFGELQKGKLNLNIKLKNNTSSIQNIAILSSIKESTGTILVETQTENVKLNSNESKIVNLNKTFSVKEENVLYILVKNSDNNEIYYEATVPFVKEKEEKIIVEEKKQFGYWIANYPYHNVFEAKINLSDEPDKDEVKKAEVKIYKLPEKKLIQGGKISEFVKEEAIVKLDLPKLAEGEYEAVATLFDGGGNEISKQTQTFKRKIFPWEHNKLGISEDILPPYTPIKAEKNKIECLGKIYTINGSGLCEQVEAGIESEKEPLLSSSMKIIYTSNDETYKMEHSKEPKFIKTAKHEVILKGELATKGLKIETDTLIEYDGMIKIDINIIPKDEIKIDALTLEIPFISKNATLMHTWNEGLRYSGFVPETEDFDVPAWSPLPSENFMPFIWIGNEDKGLCWFAESDENWSLDDKKAGIEVVRRAKQVVLLLNIINKPTVLTNPRKITFGFLATPVKPFPVGWRTWGSPLSKTELPGKRVTGHGGNWPGLIGIDGFSSGDFNKTKKWAMERKSDDDKIAVYMVTSGMPLNQPEFEVFKGEWNGLNPYYTEFCGEGYLKQEGDAYPFLYRTREACTKAGAALTQSNIDMRVWYLNELNKNCDIDGGYWDGGIYYPWMGNIVTGTAYKKDDGTLAYKWALFNCRQLHKRFATVCYQNKKESFNEAHTSGMVYIPVITFMNTMLGGEWLIQTDEEIDLIDLWRLDIIRAEMGKQWGLVPKMLLMTRAESGEWVGSDVMPTRSGLAICILHDIIPYVAYGNPHEWRRFEKAKAEFGIGESDVEFIGYWTNKITSDSKDVKISVYKRKSKVLLAPVNIGKKGVMQTVDLSNLKLVSIKKIYDAQTGEDLIQRYNNGKLTFFVPRHDFRIILIETY